MVEGMTNDGWTSATRNPDSSNACQGRKCFSLFRFFARFFAGRTFSFLFVWPYFSDKSLSIPKTQDVRLGKVIHCYQVRMLNSPSVVWLDWIGNMALVVQVSHRRRFLSDWKAVLSAGLGRHLLVPFRFVGRSHFPVDCGSFGPSKIMGTAISNPGHFCCSCCRTELLSSVCGGLCISSGIWSNRNKCTLISESLYSQSSQNDRIIYLRGDGEAGVGVCTNPIWRLYYIF